MRLSRVAFGLAAFVGGGGVFLDAHQAADLEAGFFGGRARAELLAPGDVEALEFAGRFDGRHAQAGVGALALPSFDGWNAWLGRPLSCGGVFGGLEGFFDRQRRRGWGF